MKRIIAAVVIVSGLGVSATSDAQHGQDELPPFACAFTMPAQTAPASIMEAALSLDGLACGRNSTSEAVTVVAPSQTGDCTAVRRDLRTLTRKPMTGLEAQQLTRRCWPHATGTRSGEVVALAKQTTSPYEYGEIANELSAYAGWSAVPARYFISGAVDGLAVFCFESDGEADILAYLEQAGFEGLKQLQTVRGTGTCREVVQAKLGIDISWREAE